jgi:hypothetical protein
MAAKLSTVLSLCGGRGGRTPTSDPSLDPMSTDLLTRIGPGAVLHERISVRQFGGRVPLQAHFLADLLAFSHGFEARYSGPHIIVPRKLSTEHFRSIADRLADGISL